MLITSGGNIVFAWSDITAAGVIRMRKVDIGGNDLWTPSIMVITSQYGVGYPRLAETNDDGIILQLLVHQGSQYYNPWHIYARKYDASGTSLWGANGVLINNAASVQIYMAPDIIPDTSGGAFSFWFDARTDNHVYAQHVLSGGTVAWTPNGVVASTAAGQMQVSPHAFYEPATNELIVFYLNKNIDQTIWGVYGQKYNSAGVRQWTDNALALVPLSNQERRYTLVNKIDGGSVITYFEKPAGDPVNEFVKAIRIDGAGTPVWAEPIVTMCSAMGGKDKLVTCINPFGQIIDAWKDFRSDTDGDIFLQNVNSDGTLGPFDIPRGYIAGLVTGPDGLTPLANVIVTTHNNDDLLAGVDTSSVDGTYGLELAPGTYHQMFELTGYADTTVTDIILAADDTTQVTVNLRGAPTCQYVVGDINSNGVRNGLDVVYGVAYFKGGPVPPYACECTPGNIWYVSGDANASCSFNGLDISFLVSYFKGGPEPQPCLDCPPAR